MQNKIINKLIIIFIVFIVNFNFVNAYEFIDPSNSGSVNGMISDIYDMTEQYEDLAGSYDSEQISTTNFPSNPNAYFWPVGSIETEERNGKLFATGTPVPSTITSYFGSKEGFRTHGHGAIDIATSGYDIGEVPVIASKSGTVIFPTDYSETQYSDNGYIGNPDGQTYGNFVKIQHSDGTYTLYGHMAKGSITVVAGDVVEQGQVIGRIGNSGSSTGMHLHFEMRDSSNNRIDPLDYVDPDNPRPISAEGGNSFSLTSTTLTEAEFVAKMEDYCVRSKNQGFCNDFSSNAKEIYNASLKNSVNPELVVVTAGAEQSWTLSAACKYTHNYWGIGITNGKGCNSGAKYSSITDGIAGYAKVLQSYSPTGTFATAITNRYNERSKAGCDPAGHGLPGTLEGMQSIYSWVGDFRYNPGSSGLGGCYYLNIIYGNTYCSSVSTCPGTSNCPSSSATTTCEQNDYTTWQLKTKAQIRYNIFGL